MDADGWGHTTLPVRLALPPDLSLIVNRDVANELVITDARVGAVVAFAAQSKDRTL